MHLDQHIYSDSDILILIYTCALCLDLTGWRVYATDKQEVADIEVRTI